MAHRVGANELTAWVRAELDGYEPGASLPTYRGPFAATVRAVWAGPFGSSATSILTQVGTPDYMHPLFEDRFLQGIPEIEELSSKQDELGIAWDGTALAHYNKLVQKDAVPRFEMMGVYSAHRVVTPAALRSVVESVRTKALELALDLQSADPRAGEVGGPTKADPAVDRAVMVNVNHIYGDVANVAQGTGISQSATVTKDDIESLARALVDLLADPKAAVQAMAIITGDDPPPTKKSKLQKLGSALGNGATAIGTGITSDVAAAGLLHLAGQFLGW